LRRVKRDERLPASFAQQRLWFIDRLESGSAFYNIPVSVRLRGKLDVVILQKCINEIFQRHEVLRTSFREVDSEPVQVVVSELTVSIRVDDLSHFSAEEKETEVQRRTQEDVQRPFTLEHPPLLRINLFRLAPQEHVLLTIMHHIISDGWSLG